MIAQVGTESACNRLGDFNGGELDGALPERSAGQRRDGDGARRSAVEKTLDLAVADHAVEQAGPASTLAGAEHGSHQRKHARGLHQ
jgi:hypothetical protein